MDEEKMALATQVYQTLCSALDNRGLNCKKEEDKLTVFFGFSGDDLPVEILIFVDAERQLIRLLSPLGFRIREEKRVEGAIATCAASCGMVDGNFSYDFSDGRITFKMTASFRESLIGEALIEYMIFCACAMVDHYNDKFLAIDKGLLSIADFIKQTKK